MAIISSTVALGVFLSKTAASESLIFLCLFQIKHAIAQTLSEVGQLQVICLRLRGDGRSLGRLYQSCPRMTFQTCKLKSEAPTPNVVERFCLSSPPAQLLPADLHENGGSRLLGWLQLHHPGLRAAAQPLQLRTGQRGATHHGVTCDPACLPTYLRVCPSSCVFFFDYKVYLTVQCHYCFFFYKYI